MYIITKRAITIGAIIMVVLMGGIALFNSFASKYGFVPEEGYVPNAETAIKIAEAVWTPIFGDEINNAKPFSAEYNKKEDCWEVFGALPENMRGGVPEIKIRKSDGKILYVSHGK